MHQSLTISMSSSSRWKMLWMSQKLNKISVMPIPWSPNTCGWYRTHRLWSPSLHALGYQLCILCISLRTVVIAQLGSNALPYSNILGQSGKSGSVSTPTSSLKSVSVRGKKKPRCLLAVELESSFDLAFDLAFDLFALFAVCHISVISLPSFWAP
jgi:hypothetical protein